MPGITVTARVATTFAPTGELDENAEIILALQLS